MPGVKGRGGPKPVPTSMLAVRGSRYVRRRGGEPRTARTLPACPTWVSPDARKYWREIGGVLDGMKVMTVADRVALGLLVDALAHYIAVKQAVYGTTTEAGTGMTTTNAAGTLVRHPLVLLMHEAWREVLQACREFGLTPSSRTGVRLHTIPGGKDRRPDGDAKAMLFRS